MTDLGDFLPMAIAMMSVRSKLALPRGVSDPWGKLAEQAGPVQELGPLTHNLLIPALRSHPELGINVFVHDDALPFGETARGWARRWLGTDRHVDRLLKIPGVRFHGGFAFGDELRLKLYAAEGLSALSRELGIELGRAVGIAVDVTQAGVERPRRYFAVQGFDREDDWPDPQPSSSHRLITVLDGRRAKTTRSSTFAPGAPIADLVTLARSVDDRELDVELVGRLAELARDHHLTLSAVAHEIDEFADGKRQTDVLVAASLVGVS